MGAVAFAIQDPGPDPANGNGNGGTGEAAWVCDAGEINNITCQNASGAPGNPAGTLYWFAASDSQSNNSYPNGGIIASANGHTQISAGAGSSSGGGNTELISGNTVDKVLASNSVPNGYFVYAQACPAGENANSTVPSPCSNWILIKTTAIKTKALPTAPIVGPAQADVATNAETLHTSNTSVPDPGNVQYWDIGLNNMQSGSPVSVFGQALRSYSSANQQITIGPSGSYLSTLLPNNRYQSVSQVSYFWSQLAAVPAQTENFTTTPVQPGVATVPPGTITHCSAQIIVANASGSTPNPTYTRYQACLNNGAGCQTTAASGIGGTPLTSDTTTFIFIDLTSGQTYNGTSQALNEDRPTWSDSQTNTIPNFTTQSWGTVAVGSVWNSSATLDTSGIVGGASIVSWSVAGVPTPPSGNNAPPNPIVLTGLVPNTQYTVTITLVEGSGCQSTLTVGTFTTLATIPQTFGIGATSPLQATSTWTSNGNSAQTTYQVQYCLNALFTTGCNTQTTGAGVLTATLNPLTPETTYYAHVLAVAVAGGTNSAYSNSASVYMPNQAPTITALNCPATSGTSTTCTATVTDNAPTTNIVCHWSVDQGGSIPANQNDLLANAGGSCPNVTVSFPGAGNYNVTLLVTDHQGQVPPGLTDSKSVSVPVQQSGGTVVINPLTFTLGQGGTTVFTSSVTDQFGTLIPNAAVTWSIGSCASLSGTNPAASITVTGQNVGSCQLTAAYPSATPGQATVNVSATAPAITGITISPNPVTGMTGLLTVTASAFQNDPLTFHWAFVPTLSSQDFSPQNSSVNTTTVTLHSAGQITVSCTATDMVNNQSTTRNFTFPVSQTISHITVSPNTVTVKTLQSQVFTPNCLDQFGNAITPCNVTWSTNGGGGVTGAGAFSSPSLGQNIRVIATSNVNPIVNGFAIANVISFDVSSAYAYPVPYKASFGTGVIHFTGLGSQASIRIYTTSGHKVFDLLVASPTYDWNVKNSSGENLASGVYFYVIESPESKKNGKLIIIQ